MSSSWERVFDFLFIRIVAPLLLVTLTALIFIGVPYLAYDAYQDHKAEKIVLKKDDWSCVKEHVYTTTTIVIVSKDLFPVTTTHHDCINYVHK